MVKGEGSPAEGIWTPPSPPCLAVFSGVGLTDEEAVLASSICGDSACTLGPALERGFGAAPTL